MSALRCHECNCVYDIEGHDSECRQHKPMTNTPSPTDEELIAKLRADDLWQQDELEMVQPLCHAAADRLESLLTDRAKLEERVREIAATAWLMGTADTDAEWAAKILPDWRDTEHDGDCVGAPITCNRCVCDSALEAADQIIALNRSTDRAT